jgi:predicted aminopeptidase
MVDQIKKYIILAGFGLLLLTVCGCESFRYYGQAIQGQYKILDKRQPISDILADPETPDFLRERLAFILEVREFAERELRLPVKNNYLTYVDLQRPYVVWNVFAAPEFSLTPKTWCYPVVGCAAYRGYFSKEDARLYADELINQGYDVYVAGVTAYSTLGWFDDPVLSTFLQFSQAQSAALIFHELAHQVLYVKGDTAFNESFATAVEQEGLQRWQTATQADQFYRGYLKNFHRQQVFIQLVMRYRGALETLYRSNASELDKRERKASILSELQNEFDRLKTTENGLAAYDNWMDSSLNNAKIGSVAAYHDFVPALNKMLTANEGDLNQFYRECHELAQTPKDERHRILNSYLESQFSMLKF